MRIKCPFLVFVPPSQDSDDIALPASPASPESESDSTATETASKEVESSTEAETELEGEKVVDDDVIPVLGGYSSGKYIFGALLILAVPIGLFFALGGLRWVKRLVAGKNARGRYRKVDDEEK